MAAKMRLIQYSFDELKFAFIHHVYLRCQSHYRRATAGFNAPNDSWPGTWSGAIAVSVVVTCGV